MESKTANSNGARKREHGSVLSTNTLRRLVLSKKLLSAFSFGIARPCLQLLKQQLRLELQARILRLDVAMDRDLISTRNQVSVFRNGHSGVWEGRLAQCLHLALSNLAFKNLAPKSLHQAEAELYRVEMDFFRVEPEPHRVGASKHHQVDASRHSEILTVSKSTSSLNGELKISWRAQPSERRDWFRDLLEPDVEA